MRFIIASTFTDSLAKLDPQSQSLVKQSAFDFQLNPENPGFQFHRVTKAKEKLFWSFRVNRDIRIILYKSAADFILCYTDHHDAAYTWAERRKMDIHPETGAAQLVEIRERTEEIVQRIYKQVEQEPALFERYEPDYLLALGVPHEWLDAVRYVGEGGFFELIGVLPEEAGEHLMQLAQGHPVPRPVLLREQDPFTHPDAKRRFRVVDQDQRLLESALAAPWEQWIVFLHPDQRTVVENDYSGPARVSGGAGTGKTVVALHRVAHLAEQNPDARILLTTFSTTLAKRLQHNLVLLIGEEVQTRVTVCNLHSLAKDLWEAHAQVPFKPLTGDKLAQHLQRAMKTVGHTEFSIDFLRSEWHALVEESGIGSWNAYKTVPRTGRSVPLGARQRRAVWNVFEEVKRALQADSLTSFSQLCFEAAHLFADAPKPFDHIVADEIQDFGTPELTFLRALVPEAPNDLFLCGDMGQRIYKPRTSFLAQGVDIRGRSTILRLNYRTTEQIRRYVDTLLPGAIADGDGETEARNAVSVLSGPEPEVALFRDTLEEADHVANWLKALLSGGYEARDIAVFARTKAVLQERAEPVLARCGIETCHLTDDTASLVEHAALGTMHRAKGLEFKAVLVVGCESELLPLTWVLNSLEPSEQDSFVEQERNLLYVACTRARERLLLTSVGTPSRYLANEMYTVSSKGGKVSGGWNS